MNPSLSHLFDFVETFELVFDVEVIHVSFVYMGDFLLVPLSIIFLYTDLKKVILDVALGGILSVNTTMYFMGNQMKPRKILGQEALCLCSITLLVMPFSYLKCV